MVTFLRCIAQFFSSSFKNHALLGKYTSAGKQSIENENFCTWEIYSSTSKDNENFKLLWFPELIVNILKLATL
jgi:hypothetical protein